MFTNDSVFVRHESCPQCGSRDNLSVWSDGHKWCFGCGYFVAPDGKALDVKVRLNQLKGKAGSKPLRPLPSDCSYSFPEEAIKWLEEAEITPAVAVKHGLTWSQEENGIIIPVKDDEHQLVMYQIRRFNTKPKYETRGRLDNHVPVLKCGQENGIIVVVEDYLSAIRVSYFTDACPLFGSHLSKELAYRLSKMYDRLLIWLDPDKHKEAISFYSKYKYLFTETATILSEKDPKLLRDEKLMEDIFGSFNYEEDTLTDLENLL